MTERSCLCRPLLVGLQYVGDCPWSRQVSGMGINWGRKDESSQTKHSGRIFTVAQFGSGNDVDPASSSFQREAERTWSLVSGPYMMDIAVPLQSCQGTRASSHQPARGLHSGACTWGPAVCSAISSPNCCKDARVQYAHQSWQC